MLLHPGLYVTRTPGSLLVPLLIYAVFVSGCVHLKDLRFALVRIHHRATDATPACLSARLSRQCPS